MTRRFPLLTGFLAIVFASSPALLPGADPAESTAPDPPGFHRIGEPGVAPGILAADPNGRFVLVQSNCETIAYDLQPKRLKTWSSTFYAAPISLDGRFILTADRYNIELWRAPSFERVRTFAVQRPEWGHTGYYNAPRIAVSAKGKWVAISNAHHAFRKELPTCVLVYAPSGQLRWQLPLGKDAYVLDLKFLGDDRLLVRFREAGKFAMGIRTALCDVGARDEPTIATKETKAPHILHTFGSGEVLRISQSQNRIATTVTDHSEHFNRMFPATRTVTVRDSKTAEIVAKVTLTNSVRDFALNPQGDRLLTTGAEQVTEYRVSDGTVAFASENSEHPYATVLYTPSGKRRLATYEVPNGLDDDVDHFPRGWDTATNKPLPFKKYYFQSHNGSQRLVFLPGEDRFFDLHSNSALHDLFTNEALVTFPKYRPAVREVAFTPDGNHMLVRNQLSHLPTGNLREWHLLGSDIRFVQQGRSTASADVSGLYLADTIHGHLYWWLALDSLYQPTAFDVSADAKRFVLSYRTNSFSDVDAAKRLLIIDPSRPNQPEIIEAFASALAIHPTQPWFVSAEAGKVVKRELSQGKLIDTIWTTPGRVTVARFSPDGDHLLLAGAKEHLNLDVPLDDRVAGWAALVSFPDGNVASLNGHASVVTAGDFSQDGKRCVTGSTDKTVRVWDVASSTVGYVYRGHRGRINNLAYSPKGDRILSAGDDGAAMLDVAGIVDRDLPRPPALPKPKYVESINAYRSNPAASQQLFPNSKETPLKDPSAGQGNWTLIELGDVSRVDGSSSRTLTNAKVRHRLPLNLGPRLPPQGPALRQFELKGASRSGRKLYISFQGREVAIVSAGNKVLARWPLAKRYEDFQISPSGKEVGITERIAAPPEVGQDVFRLRIVDAFSGELLRTIDDSGGVPHISPDERTFYSVNWRGVLRLIDYQTGAELAEEKYTVGGPGVVARYSPDGRYLATSKYPATQVQIRDAASLQIVRLLDNPFPIRWFRFSPAGDRIFVGQEYARERTMMSAWNVESGEALWREAGPLVKEGRFSNDGRYYLSRPDYNTWSLWDLTAGEVKTIIISESGGPRGTPVFSQDGTTLRQGSPNGRQLWPIVPD